MEEGTKKNNIIAITDGSAYGDSAVRYGYLLAAIFNASLTVVASLQSRYSCDEVGISDSLKETMNRAISNNIDVFLENTPLKIKQLYPFAEENNTIMFVIGVSVEKRKKSLFNLNRAIRFIKPSRIPVMTVGKQLPSDDIFKEVMLPLDIHRQSKEKSLWAGYFSRFYCATVHILYSHYHDEFLKMKIQNNIDFVKKLYDNLEIKYEIHKLGERIDNMDNYSLVYAPEINATLTVIMMTAYRSLFDLIFGEKERLVIGNKKGLPVLCINEREDLYVLCT
jgi:hypothetical protein